MTHPEFLFTDREAADLLDAQSWRESTDPSYAETVVDLEAKKLRAAHLALGLGAEKRGRL